MKSILQWFVLAALAGTPLVAWSVRHVAAQQRTKVTVTRLFTGPDGQTHSEEIEMKMLPVAASAPVNAGTETAETVKATGAQFRRWAPGYVNTWHTAPRRQYVITLSGRSEVELADGKKDSTSAGNSSSGGRCDGQGPHHAFDGDRRLDFHRGPSGG
jgi:hypothetical protein